MSLSWKLEKKSKSDAKFELSVKTVYTDGFSTWLAVCGIPWEELVSQRAGQPAEATEVALGGVHQFPGGISPLENY